MGKRDEMILQVTQKEQNKKLVTRQTESPYQRWERIQQFQINGNNLTKVTHIINYELPTTGKIAYFLSGTQSEDKIRQGIQQSAQTVKQKL